MICKRLNCRVVVGGVPNSQYQDTEFCSEICYNAHYQGTRCKRKFGHDHRCANIIVPESEWGKLGVCSEFCYQALFVPGEIPVDPEDLASGGTRADKGKPAMHLIPPDVLIELGKLFELGARKYSPDNWRRGMDYSRMYSSLMRHILYWWAGEDFDPVDGQHHLDSVIWGAVCLRYFELHRDNYWEFDDRYYDPKKDSEQRGIAQNQNFAAVYGDRQMGTSESIKHPAKEERCVRWAGLTLLIPKGFRELTPNETIKTNDLTWDEEKEWVEVPKNNDNFAGYYRNVSAPVIRATIGTCIECNHEAHTPAGCLGFEGTDCPCAHQSFIVRITDA